VQADSSTTRKFGGTGLGLSISRRLAEAMGGALTVHSEVGIGSTFRIEIPTSVANLQDMVSPEELARLAKEKTAGAVSSELQRLPSKRVLVVDDGEANRRLIELVLKRAGAVVLTAEHGREALEMIDQGHQSGNPYALVLMDMQMPVLDGYSATRQLREQDDQTPVIALTGNAMRGDREKCIDAGCDDFLTKPVNLDELLQMVSQYLGPVDPGTLTNTNILSPANVLSPAVASDVAQNGLSGIAALPPATADSATPALPASAIVPTLPMDDEDFRAIAGDFVSRLESRLNGIEQAIQESKFDFVHGEAHWLKGAGGTVGLDVFTQPARTLEQAAKDESADIAQSILQEIRELHGRVLIPGMDTQSHADTDSSPDCLDAPAAPMQIVNPIHCTLPLDDPDFHAIVSDFIVRLDARLKDMRSELSSKRFEELGLSAHWLKGAGGTVGYDDLTQPSRELIDAAQAANFAKCESCLSQIEAVRRRMILPGPVPHTV
jgi:CheY-like chemotaxis protein/HPt (histidine-containing phosphotransfer) domain-containing protein